MLNRGRPSSIIAPPRTIQVIMIKSPQTLTCLLYTSSLLRLARRELKGKAWDGFLSDTLSMELAALERLEGELKHFTAMFDYRNAGADWGSSRDALPRVIAKLRGAPRPDED